MKGMLSVDISRCTSCKTSELECADAEALVDCILCGLCVRACPEAIGASAISFADRGPNRRVASPFDLNSTACIGCGGFFAPEAQLSGVRGKASCEGEQLGVCPDRRRREFGVQTARWKAVAR